MKYFIVIFSLILSAKCLSQTDTTVLIVPLISENISIDRHVDKILQFNNVQGDSLKKYIQQLTADRLKNTFPGFSFINLQSIKEYKYLADSITISELWCSSQYRKINESLGLKKIFSYNENRTKFKYYGRSLRSDYTLILKALLIKYKLKYIFFINKFEVGTRSPFSNQTYFCLHFEIYDKTLNRIYGGKSFFKAETTKKMFYNAFCIYLRKAIDEFYKYTKSCSKP
jgi:hypothetical protein